MKTEDDSGNIDPILKFKCAHNKSINNSNFTSTTDIHKEGRFRIAQKTS